MKQQRRAERQRLGGPPRGSSGSACHGCGRTPASCGSAPSAVVAAVGFAALGCLSTLLCECVQPFLSQVGYSGQAV